MNVSYLLLNAIQTAYIEAPTVHEFLQKQEIVERLLVCGVFCDPLSMVSSQAFRLLRLILYPDLFGSTDDQSESLLRTLSSPGMDAGQIVRPPPTRPNFDDIVTKFAAEFVFCEPPLPQMIAAMSIFWNHRYPVLPNIDPNAKPDVVKPLQLAMDGGGAYEVDVTGRTPLELCNHYLLEEPAWSDALNFRIMQILVSEDRRINEFRQGGRPRDVTEHEFRRKIREYDTIFLRFLTTKFQTRQPLALQIAHGMDSGQVQRQATQQSVRDTKDEEVPADMGFVSHLLGALPDDTTLAKLRIHFRVPLNGYIYKFARFWSKRLWFQEPVEGGDLEFYEIIDKVPALSDQPLQGLPPEMGAMRSAMGALKARWAFERALKADVQRELEDKSEPRVAFHATTSPECGLPPPEGWTDFTRPGP